NSACGTVLARRANAERSGGATTWDRSMSIRARRLGRTTDLQHQYESEVAARCARASGLTKGSGGNKHGNHRLDHRGTYRGVARWTDHEGGRVRADRRPHPRTHRCPSRRLALLADPAECRAERSDRLDHRRYDRRGRPRRDRAAHTWTTRASVGDPFESLSRGCRRKPGGRAPAFLLAFGGRAHRSRAAASVPSTRTIRRMRE